MMLPKVNTFPKYDSVIPSTQKKVRFRPYNVGEEKILLIAYEADDKVQIAKAILDIVESCVEDDINKNTLSVFDVEYLFLQIRSKAVGETSTVVFTCAECQHDNSIEVKIDSIQIDVDSIPSTKIQITDDYVLELKFPVYKEVIEHSDTLDANSLSELLFQLVLRSLSKLHTPDELIDFKDVDVKEIEEFINNLTTDQYAKLINFIENLPKLSQLVEYDCEECAHHNKYNLQGLSDFF